MAIFRSALVAAVMILSTQIHAAGFGIDFGADPSSFNCSPVPSSPGYFRCGMPPKPHSAFEQYIVKASPEHGICWVKGVGKDISDNRFGSATRSAVDEMTQTLTRLYGPAEKTDILVPRALWNEANEWLMAIVQNERLYAYQWKDLKSERPMLKSVAIMAQATAASTGYISLEYYSEFNEECSRAITESEADAL